MATSNPTFFDELLEDFNKPCSYCGTPKRNRTSYFCTDCLKLRQQELINLSTLQAVEG
jgi:hypothetical protein